MSLRHVVNVVGLLLVVVAIAMALSTAVALWYGDGDALGLALSTVISAAVGFVAYRLTRFRDDIGSKEGYGIVAFAWSTIGVFGALPYLLTGSLGSIPAAVFESISGFTTTGATVFSDIESLPRGVLFWRSITQWLGGMGIIVLVIAVLPYLGVGGMQLFRAEVPGPTTERLRPRITQTAKLLWFVYLGLTTAQVVLYLFGGLSLYDAVNHAFTTLATGGFSTKNASIAAFDSAYVHYVTIVFMYLAGVNFALHFRAVSGRPPYLREPEWRFYTGLILASSLAIALVNLTSGSYGWGLGELERAGRDALFQVVSIVTTTGYITADYELWAPGAVALILALMLTGGMAGSTGGGIKSIRILLILKHMGIQIRRHLHPRGIFLASVGGRKVKEEIMDDVLGFVLLYGMLAVAGIVGLALLGVDAYTSIGAVLSSLGNIGPGVGEVGAVDNYGWMSGGELGLLTLLMLVGRLELYTVVLLFHPEMWTRTGRTARSGLR
ncbi:MAG: TrkH family potassium uptake protein [Gemmatimonadota bacterium]